MTVARGTSRQRDSATASMPDCRTVVVVPSRSGRACGARRQAGRVRQRHNRKARRGSIVSGITRPPDCVVTCWLQRDILRCIEIPFARSPMLLRRTIPFALALGAFACSGTEPFVPVPTAIGGARALTAVVLDQRGDTIRSPSVQWSVGAGSVASVDQTGHVSAVGLGTTKVFASAQGSATPIKDSVTVSVAQIPAQLVKVAGDQQVDTTSGALPTAVVVQVNDSFAHPIEGVAVGFAVTQGGGSVTPGTATTDVQGQAAVVWTLGSAAGPNALTATVTGTGITGNPASFGATAVAAGSMPSVAVLAGDGQTGLA